VKGFTLGQVQLWINAAFALALVFFALEWRTASGLVLGVLSLLKPHYGLIVMWGLRNREWNFAIALLSAAILGLAFSVWTFGFANHLDYLSVVSFMSERGESYYPNQSINGLLNRFIGRSFPELYHNADYGTGGFPPYNGWVYWPALVASAAILVSALLRRSDDSSRLISLCLMAVSVTIAAPIAWEHHYGLLLPVYAVAFPALAASRSRLLWLALSYLLVATFIGAARLLAPGLWNVFQSYMLFGAFILLALLHGLLRTSVSAATPKTEMR
jgi:alpha-1,2-mannosyltransferase